KALFDEGIVQREPVGRRVWYSIAPDRHDEVAELLRSESESTVSEHVLERIQADLAVRFAGTFSAQTVRRYVRESYDLLATRARVTRYLPSLTARFAGDRLSALARSEGDSAPRPE